VTDPLDQETTFTDGSAGQLLTTDPLSQTTTFGYGGGGSGGDD
jgi:hypothetical protein